MPRNEGIRPPISVVDIRFRGGHVVRNAPVEHYRWTIDDPAFPPNYDFDIAHWQPVGAAQKGRGRG